jgi:rare lipoprotein A
MAPTKSVKRAGWRRIAPALALFLAACGSVPKAPPPNPAAAPGNVGSPPPTANSASHVPNLPPAGSGRGGYYQDDGPGDAPPDGLLELPDPIPKVEPYSSSGNKPYMVFGKTYTPITDLQPFKQRGVGTWYGKKFHGQKTSSGEPYDMYKLTAAHPTLPIPSYARVTNLSNGVQIIVRINDRGPFHSSRIIDLSYAAALKLGYLGKGSSELEVERLLPDEIARIAAAKQQSRPIKPDTEALTDARGSSTPSTAAPDPNESVPVAMSLPVANEQPAEHVALVDFAPGASQAAVPMPSNDAVVPVGGYYLQFGAFTEEDNAEAVRARLMQNWDRALPPLEIAYVGVFYRLHSGPFASRAEAAAAAQTVQSSGIKPMVVQH